LGIISSVITVRLSETFLGSKERFDMQGINKMNARWFVRH